jgi:ribosomal protein S18 acetylase RimI-like enzyme
MSILKANTADIPHLLQLVNSAFRGPASKQGWTTEADLLEGDLRIDAAGIEAMLQNPTATILKYINTDGAIDGCVYLQQQGLQLYLGMLTVSPTLQGAGIGKMLLAAAETHAIACKCSSIVMRVISVRKELIAWYLRHHYKLTGIKEAFPVNEKFGRPTQTLEFDILEKELPPAF